MAGAVETTVFLGALIGIFHVFSIFPHQYNARVVTHALFAALTVLILLVSIATGHFSNPVLGILVLLVAAATLTIGTAVHQNSDAKRAPGLIGLHATLAAVTIVLVFGAAGLGLFS